MLGNHSSGTSKGLAAFPTPASVHIGDKQTRRASVALQGSPYTLAPWQIALGTQELSVDTLAPGKMLLKTTRVNCIAR